MRMQVQPLPLLSGLRVWHCCRLQTWLGSIVAVDVVQANSCSTHSASSLGTSIGGRCSPKKIFFFPRVTVIIFETWNQDGLNALFMFGKLYTSFFLTLDPLMPLYKEYLLQETCHYKSSLCLGEVSSTAQECLFKRSGAFPLKYKH